MNSVLQTIICMKCSMCRFLCLVLYGQFSVLCVLRTMFYGQFSVFPCIVSVQCILPFFVWQCFTGCRLRSVDNIKMFSVLCSVGMKEDQNCCPYILY